MNKRLLPLFLAILLLGAMPGYAQTQSQNDQPKIGLTLSGGGAKGIAYIGLLKKIDSLGIKVSYVTGTSMGGIMGGLYAMGYSGKQLESIVRHIDWNRVLSNNIPLTQVNILEKSEYGNYLIEMPITNGRPSLPGSLIEGQYLSEILNTYTYPAHTTDDFSKLFIPLQIMTSDIVNGGVVIQKKGSLPLAIRATMSIPAVFSTVYIDGKVLVDGGITQNYPVQQVRAMGADYVIGGYTGFRIMKENQIQSPINQLMQAFSFSDVVDAKKQMAATDLLIDYSDILDSYSAADFAKYNEILKRGEIEAEKYLPQLIAIANQQHQHNIALVRPEMVSPQNPVVKYNFMTDRNEPITDASELAMLNKMWLLKTNRFYDVADVNKAIQALYGTRFYSKVFYTFKNGGNGLEMNVYLTRGEKGHFKASVHYDTDQSAGIVLNYTYYNLLLDQSRFLATIDATERFKARLNYYKYISNDNKLWVRANAEYRNLKSNDVLLSLLSTDNLDSPPPDYYTRNFKAALSLGYSFTPSAYVEAGLNYDLENIYKSKNLAARILGLNPQSTVYNHHNEALFIRVVQNTTPSPYYAVSGNKLESELKYAFDHTLNLSSSNNTNDAGNIYNYLNPDGNLYKPTGVPGNTYRFYLKDQYAYPVAKKLSLKVSAMAGFNSSTRFGTNNTAYLYLNNYFSLGGTDEREIYSNVGFVGLKQGEVPIRGLSAFTFSAQYNPFKDLYLIPMLSYAAESNGYNVVGNIFNNSKDYVGYGMHVGYMSIVGPVDFVVSKSTANTNINFPWRAYLSFGYKF
jgi:NTE family protein